MNYIRGAVNVISAPYQYYRDLPPINPSTLTGAIDVIVIQRPTGDGDTELVCSPFHVRFGKWQVLRPSEKKVNLFVNGNPIPFNMKIGEAGEAFFVFETDEDVPADLITSPILQPTIPGTEENEDAVQEPVNTEHFGAKQDERDAQAHEDEALNKLENEHFVEPDFLDLDGRPHSEDATEDVRTTPKQTYRIPKSLRKSGSRATINQASALSLPSPSPSRDNSNGRSHTPKMEEQDKRVDAALKALSAESHIPEVDYHHDIALDMEGYKQGYHDRERSDRTVRSPSDSTSQSSPDRFEFSPYHSSSPSLKPTPSPVLSHTQSTFLHTPYETSPPSSPSESASPSPPTSLPHPFPFRATSEPPPDIETDNDTSSILTLSAQRGHPHPQLQLGMSMEYSWEWGAFPQPSPMKPSFGKGGRLETPTGLWGSGSSRSNRKSRMGFGERKGRLGPMVLPPVLIHTVTEGEERTHERGHGRHTGGVGRSKSVPPNYLDSLARKGRRGSREYREYEDAGEHCQEDAEEDLEERNKPWDEEKVDKDVATKREEDSKPTDEAGVFGAGGTLSASIEDLTMFVLGIEGKKIGFQLSLIPPEGEDDSFSEDEAKGRQGIINSRTKERPQDEVEAARLFDRYCIDWTRFMDDETIVHDQRLIIRWAGNQYITRKDGSPLMDALVLWRSSTLQKRASGDLLRPVSPPPPGQETSMTDLLIDERLTREDHKHHGRSKSEPPSEFEKRQAEADDQRATMDSDSTGHHQGQGPVKKPTSSSWVQWWSRSRRTKVMVSGNAQVLDPAQDSSTVSLPLSLEKQPPLDEKPKAASSNLVKTSSVPSTPVQSAADAPRLPELETTPTRAAAPPTEPAPIKRFAKTLRLTSDQLKSLKLRPGANAITFSLSASGAIAATARIFVWDATDLVVISDIDGTITKSDGLGHVFAMIGRDWTHLGVAKLYTDITRNGYKIMYLTSRAIGQADATRDYLKGIKQNNYQLPEGPVIMSPDRLMASLHREVIMRKPEVFKMACLRDIQRLFGESARNPFYAGFGNRITDALSYRSVNVPSARIFTIDTTGVVKMELLELAGYKSSYIHMTDLVDQMFPPIHRKWTPEYTDFNYWKTPVREFPLPDFSPPSPALSARSDTSNQSTLSRIRNFGLGGSANHSRQNTMANGNGMSDGDSYRSSHLRQMSSFEKLSSTLGFSSRANDGDVYRRSASPSSSSSYAGSDEEEEGDIGPDGQRRKRMRRRSMASMPGTLDEIHFGLDDEDDEEEGDHHENEDVHFAHGEGAEGEEVYDGEVDDDDAVEQDSEEAFDDDLLAAGEMQKVPFL